VVWTGPLARCRDLDGRLRKVTTVAGTPERPGRGSGRG
jgi:hypothetical protein